MDEKMISRICMQCFSQNPESVERCAVGQGNYVYIVECAGVKYVVRCSMEQNAYPDTIYWLEKLASIDIPIPKVIAKGKFDGYEYMILSYFEGEDIGLVYEQLTDDDKKEIAKEIAAIQDKVAALTLEKLEPDWSWRATVEEMLERSRERIVKNGYFDAEKVDRLWELMEPLEDYFASIKPVAYLDDVSTKNLLIHNGRISGIVDIDWMGIGDKLTYVALTNMALLNMECDTDYVKYILDEMQLNDVEKKAFLFYTLVFCVDFMGERGMQFMDKTIEVNEQIIDRLNGIYDQLLKCFLGKYN
ncbi:MAG: phosphotransferase [Lachnospiraceae bacterium]|nr:phosphotransferase [Lachnospiraceae bacterium]